MKLLSFLIILFGLYSNIYSQPAETSNVFLGTNYGIKRINKDSFNIDTTYKLSVIETSGALNTKNGRLILYSNQDVIMDSNHNIVSNGLTIKSNSSAAQGTFFYQHPERPYIDFFTNMGGSSNISGQGLYHHYLEYNGIKIIPKSINNLLRDSTNEAIGIISHPNGKDLWIVTHGYWFDSFFTYNLNTQGICKCPKSIKSNFNNKSIFGAVSQIDFNERGNHFYISSPPNTFSNDFNQILYSFNLQNGSIEKKFTLPYNYPQFGVPLNDTTSIFSYADVLNDTVYIYMHKIDVKDSTKSINSRVILKSVPYGSGSKGRIIDFVKISNNLGLFSRTNCDYISALKYVNDSWVFIDTFLYSPNIVGNYRFPVFDVSIFYTPSIDFTYDLDCRSNTIAFGGKDTFGANSFTYKINKNNSNIATLTSNKNQNYTFEDTGVYEVLYIASNGSRTDTVTKTIEVLAKVLKDFLGADRAICAPDTSLLLQAPAGLHCYRWYDNKEQELGSSNQYLLDTIGSYICKATDNNFCTVVDTVFIGKDTLKYGLHLSRNKDTLFCSNTPTKNNPQFHWYKNESGLISLLVPKLTIKDTGIYYLIITQDSLCPSYSDTLHIDTIYGPTNINLAPIVETNLSIYPNPANTYIMVDWQGTNPITLQWIDAVGKTVLEQTFAAKSNSFINIQQLSTGLYSIQANGMFVGKIVVE